MTQTRNAFCNATMRAAALACTLLITACGGGGSSPAASSAVGGSGGGGSSVATKSLSGSVAVGAPMTNGLLRIVDAEGTAVGTDLPINDAGRYEGVTLTGTAPWRLEACGQTGQEYQCLHSLAQDGGTANITPLTQAMLVLATGKTPAELMDGAQAPDPAALTAAQNQIRAGLADILAQAGLPATLDLITGALSAGSRNGYDRVLDAIGVTLGKDDAPFVQITPRMGSGNLYLQAGQQASGQITPAAQSNSLPLEGLEALFAAMTQAMQSPQACANAGQGLASLVADTAKLELNDNEAATGATAVSNALCGFMAGGNGEPTRFGSRLTSPTLGRCDFSSGHPVCAVSFVMKNQEGEVEPIGEDMTVSYQNGAWKFNGDARPLRIHARTVVQRHVRIDGPSPVVSFKRALAIEIPAAPGVQCARVEQSSAEGAPVTVALYKPHDSGAPKRLSVWRSESDDRSRSLEPSSGQTRSADDSWLRLPEGASGDVIIRRFMRGGRQVAVTLYSDTACSIEQSIAGRSHFEVDIEGVPPIAAELPNLPWPTLTPSSRTALRNLTLAADSSTSFNAEWRYERGQMGVRDAVFCSDLSACGEGGAGRLGETRLRPRDTTAALTVHTGAQDLPIAHVRMFALHGRAYDGLGLESAHMSCPDVATEQSCVQ